MVKSNAPGLLREHLSGEYGEQGEQGNRLSPEELQDLSTFLKFQERLLKPGMSRRRARGNLFTSMTRFEGLLGTHKRKLKGGYADAVELLDGYYVDYVDSSDRTRIHTVTVKDNKGFAYAVDLETGGFAASYKDIPLENEEGDKTAVLAAIASALPFTPEDARDPSQIPPLMIKAELEMWDRLNQE